MNEYIESGADRLWTQVSYTSWLTMPRVLMQQMPDEWQGKMADLIAEYDERVTIPSKYWCDTEVTLKKDGKYIKAYEWVLNYKYPSDEVKSWVK